MAIEQIEIQLIASVVAAACALPGVFLVLRRMAMMSDAISHTVLLGIVLTFFLVRDLTNPLLIIGAAAMGVLTVMIVEAFGRTKLLRQDAAIGLTFPILFSIAIILISLYARDVHLDAHVVFQGDLVFTPFDRFVLFGIDLGPRMLIIMGTILIINLALILLFYKELKVSTFDASLAASFGFSPILIHYGLMTMVSITAVGAFDAVGSILVIAFMIVPPVTAYLITDRLSTMLWLSVLIGVVGSIIGYWVAHQFDTTIGGTIVTILGLIFGLVFFLTPNRGLISIFRRRLRQKWEFAITMLAIHLSNHEGQPDYDYESRIDHMHQHMFWDVDFSQTVITKASREGVIKKQGQQLILTDVGRMRASQALVKT